MTLIKTKYNRRSFLKVSAASAGGLMLGFNWSCAPNSRTGSEALPPPSEWFSINGYLNVADNGQVTIFSPNPEIGQNVKTSMPVVVAEELDVDWKHVIVKQAPLNTSAYSRQVAGGSQSIRKSWESLRMAGATARKMLVNAAAKQWNTDPATLTTSGGVIKNKHGEELTYGEVASAAAKLEIPEKVALKDPSEFKIIGHDTRNVDTEEIITGKPLFGIDTKKPGMVYAVMMRPPAFGLKLESYDDINARQVNGVQDVIQIGDKIAVIATSTWAAMKGKKALKANWKEDSKPESTTYHNTELNRLLDKKSDKPKRKDGDVEQAFAEADKVVEKVYEAPFLPHNTLEPMNFYANVTDQKVELIGPIQTPEGSRKRIAKMLNRDEKDVQLDMTRMGGGFGRRLYGDFVTEAAEISDKIRKPVQLVYTREDDMTAGIYRPSSKYKMKAAIKEGRMTAYHITGAGTNMGNTTRENNWPAAALDHYLAETHRLKSNITVGAWRAPVTNFLGFAEQSFIDEVAFEAGKDPVVFRLELFERAKTNPVGHLDYDVDKFIGVIKLAAEKGKWEQKEEGVYKGFSAYYSHNSYVAEVAEVVLKNNEPVLKRMTVAIDCGIVVNPIAAINQAQGGVIDGIGHAMFGDLTFEDGKPTVNNFDRYRLGRMKDAPPEVNIHFVKSNNDPTGLGEPTLPPASAAVANAIFAATGKRIYRQPFVKDDAMVS